MLVVRDLLFLAMRVRTGMFHALAWMNEALCKLIYVNLRTSITTEEETATQ